LKEEYIIDMESQKTLLHAINRTLKQKNYELVKQHTSHATLNQHRLKFNRGFLILMVAIVPIAFFITHDFNSVPTRDSNSEFRTSYLIDNLQGDIVETWVHWNIIDSERVTVNIVDADLVSAEKITAIKNAILSEKAVQIDDYLLHKAPRGTSSTYYEGWQGAILAASKNPTEFYIPRNFVVLESARGEGDITIQLLNENNSDGYTGYTKSTVEKNQILKSTITIYNVDELSADQLNTVILHEFGHALGLGHSTAPEDLMAPTITTAYPYISGCDIDALSALYDGKTSSDVTCKK